MITIHHLNCGTMCPFGGRFIDGFSRGLTAKLVCHCLLIETKAGLVLIDTGFGLQDIRNAHHRLGRIFLKLIGIQLQEEQTALRQIEKLGFKRQDVRHIILTHLDFDHAGGITDFPEAQVHVLGSELEAARHPHNFLARQRYRSQQWSSEKNWVTYALDGEKWFGFESVRDLKSLPPEILLVPLAGHTRGHTGVAVRAEDGWLLHAGDAYFFRGEMDPEKYHCTLGLRLFQRIMEVDRKVRLENQERLRQLNRDHHQEVQIFSAHDAIELEKFRP
ncbi:beta-lactamase domain protein [Nitrosococcus halophilus Nc 4]|uniref:Beta-lactamase domain protein n=1 Tax=Nitrosococcus halophilus (strain Nc4) TaxID=472759 RepID=D5BYJ3_NITHN|nr:MBL fold metallo-hydrolase [Nitrosococcus halophilus]ADE15981.1 beta-lactamase domain protein [Nitrosococcus halophilus Nc 4]